MAAPAFVALLIVVVFGEGDYIVPVLACLWGGLGAVALRVHKNAEQGTVSRYCWLFVTIYSFVLALIMAACAIAFFV